jgi:flagellar protein FlgJ
MINSTNPYANTSGNLAVDVKDLGGLRQAAKENSPEALKATAKQFEALFMNMMLKSMRDATPQEGMFDNQQTKMYTSMLDQQLSQTMASRGIGLAEVLVQQLSAVKGMQPMAEDSQALPGVAVPDGVFDRLQRPGAAKANANAGREAVDSAMPVSKANDSRPAHIRAFHERLGAHADEASRATGIPAKFMLGQAALESGWGRREIKAADGSSSHNLFGIKATAGWKGKVVEAATTEYVNGVPQTRIEKFRAYDSYADSFRDYARMLRNNPRYENVLANAQDASGFAQGLQKAGYATDPHYAAKLTKIIKQSLSV